MRNSDVRSYSGTDDSWRCLSPACIWRRYSWYIASMWRTVAMRSGIWAAAPQAEHQVRMSCSDGLRAPFSILETLVKCQPITEARARPVRFASLRISRRRAPRASRACCTGVVKLGRRVLAVRDRSRPCRLEGSQALADEPRVCGQLLTLDRTVAGQVSEYNGLAVETPEVIAREQQCRRPLTREPPDIFAGSY